MSYTLDCAVPKLMAILNVTPDSFYAGSRTFEKSDVEQRAKDIVAQGADIVDIGGYSSRPGASDIPVAEETRRVMLGIEALKKVSPDINISVDTFRSEVAETVLETFGRGIIINDISASESDGRMADVAAKYDAVYIAMHMRGNPKTMQQLTQYENVTEEVAGYLLRRIEWLQERGVRKIILDPGFGFAKTIRQNYELLANLDRIKAMGYPVLAGLSRKSLVYRPLGITPEDALPGTIALHWEALRKGADIIRVHDVRESRQLLEIFKLYEQYGTTGQQHN